mgnify:CR=1 FL=1
MALTFKGGLHPEENKITAKRPIEVMPEPATVSIAMSQHIGAPCKPLVQVGDYVKMYQKIGENPDAPEAKPLPMHDTFRPMDEVVVYDSF